MDKLTSEIEKRVQQIKESAIGNAISYNTMLDILEDKNPPLQDDQIAKIIEELTADGINIVTVQSSRKKATLARRSYTCER